MCERRKKLRAAVISGPGELPVVKEFDDPPPVDGAVAIDVRTAALGGWDAQGAYAYQLAIQYPCVIRGEGVGHAPDGRRVYFGERSVPPFGAWAECTVVPAAEVWEVPDDIDDKLAIALGIAGTAALVPLTEAAIKPGENVLVLGATGTVGQIALQLARYLGAGRVVAAGRDQQALERVAERGVADGIAQIGAGDDVGALKASAGDGFDVVLDVVYGEPFVAALKATRFGARIMTIGAQAGMTAMVALPDLLFRTHTCVGTGQQSPEGRQALWRRLLDISRERAFVLDYAEYALDDAPQAWEAQKRSPHAKVIAAI
jgi:NADPH2:quinone reductase